MYLVLCAQCNENLLSMDKQTVVEETVATGGVVQLDVPSLHKFLECMKDALVLLVNIAAQTSTSHHELGMDKDKSSYGLPSSGRFF